MNAVTDTRPEGSQAILAPQLEVHDARDLIKNGVQACILLDGQAYYLRITRAGKLILTK